ncbi:MFS transporter [Jatrophihabitans lederbergiae]|uniref:MFS transporter n=1 Tax=Jatrophihabitans lederbergiae TaxID=3075547 RepID=A0ABU2JE54_9ACTN|nr:MFS transporter [Jatrophihabitans sp. DSM 44399]MDT0263261.1 MFS transporter [Jatrophihabitans sp. DSM 44399]
MITLDAVVVNVALPTLHHELGGGISALQWVVDGYTLMFAALLLTAGGLTDRIGAHRAFTISLGVFLAASLACGLAPSLPVLVAARFVQGSAAALMTPSSMALIRHAYDNAAKRARAVAIWAMGGAVASSSGPVLGGVLTTVNWRLIFLINLPVGLVALALLRYAVRTSPRPAPIDWLGQTTGIVAMTGLTFGAIEAGTAGFTSGRVLIAFVIAVVATAAFVTIQSHVRHPMLPLTLFRNQAVSISVVIGFAFMVGYYGLPFVFSLYFQQQRGFSALATGALFLPMMLIGAVLTPFSARLVERMGPKLPIISGLVLMAAGLVLLGMLPASTPVGILSVSMILVGLGGLWSCRRQQQYCSTTFMAIPPVSPAAYSTPAAKSAARWASRSSAHCWRAQPASCTASASA